MLNFFDYTIPVWHPLLVHFPIVMIPLAFLAVLLWNFKKDEVWRRIALVLYAFSLIFGFLSYQSGEALEHENEGEAQVERFVENHEMGAKIVMLLSLSGVVVLGFAELRRRKGQSIPTALPLLALFLGFLNMLAIAYTGHLGGLMTWGIPLS